MGERKAVSPPRRMSFLTPLFLLGALAVALPVLFHLIRRTTREKTLFSSLMFLLPTPPRVTKRSRIEHWFLLLLRCLVILLLAAGFARPFLREVVPPAQAGDTGRRTVVLLDTSASMKRAGVWADALAQANKAVKDAAPGDELAVFAFDRSLRPVVNFADWNNAAVSERAALAAQRLGALQPTAAGTHLGAALLQAAELLEPSGANSPTNGVCEIILISDLQEGSRLDGLQGHEWPRGVTVTLRPVKARHPGNAGVHWLTGGDGESASAQAPEARFRVVNAAGSKTDRLQLRWRADGGAAGEPLDVYVPAGESRVVPAPKPAPEGDAQLTLTGDTEEFDNTASVVRAKPARLPVLYIGDDAESDPTQPLYFLRRAFPQTARQIVEIVARKTTGPPLAADYAAAQLVILADAPSRELLEPLAEFARNGRLVLVALRDSRSLQELRELIQAPDLRASDIAGEYTILGQIDFQHPLFAPFADPRFSDFTKIHFWKHRRLNAEALPAGARVVAKFDDGDPAIVQVPLGRGGVVVLTSGWHPADSQLALSSKFVPLLHALLELSASLPAQRAQYFVGDEVPLPPGQQALTVRRPDGREVAAEPGGKFRETDVAGIYTVNPAGWRFAVNLAPEESRTAPLGVDQLLSLGVPLKEKLVVPAATTVQQQARLQATELEGRQKLWRWLIVAALGVLMVETWLAARATNRPRAASEPGYV
jgi:hypothetical protein